MDINIQAPVDMVLRAGSWFGSGPNGETVKVAISLSHGICQIYCDHDDGNGGTYYYHMQGPYAFRETDNGIQWYTGSSWNYFPKVTQEQYSGILAEKAILGDD